MTIASQTSRITYTGNSSTTAFAIPFYFAANADIVVYLVDTLGASTLQVLGTNYSLTGATLAAGGTCTFVSAPTTGYTVTIYRDPAVTQTTSYNNNDPFPAKSHELALDKLTTIAQRVKDSVSRSIHQAEGEASTTTQLDTVANRKNKLLGFGTSGELLYVNGPTFVGTTYTGVAEFDSTASATVATIAASVNIVRTGGTTTPGDGGGGMFKRVVSQPSTGVKFQSADGAWWQRVGAAGSEYATLATATAAYIASTIDWVRTAGYATAGDGGAAIYKRHVGLPAHPGYFQSADLSYWEIADLELNVKQFGAKGDNSTNDTAAINNCMESAYQLGLSVYLPSGTYRVDEASAGVGHAILNKGISMRGAGTQKTVIAPKSTMPSTASYIKVQYQNGVDVGFQNISDFLIYSGIDGPKKGLYGLYLLNNVTANVSQVHIHDVYVTAGNDYSFVSENNQALNAQGCPSNSTIERCAFWEGTHLTQLGDSVVMRNCILRSTSTRAGALVFLTASAGTASLFIFEENNCDCGGAALSMADGGRIRVLNNNIECTAGVGTNGAVIDLDGSSGTIPFAEVIGNLIGISGTATVTAGIRLNGTSGARLDHNTVISGITITNGILITASSADAHIGFHEISSTFTNKIADSGSGTRGVLTALTLSNSFTNTGSGYDTAGCTKSNDGTVRLVGFLNCPASPNSKVIATLPAGYRPVTQVRHTIWGGISGTDTLTTVDIAPAGTITFNGGNTVTQIILNNVSFPTTNYVVASL